MTDKIKKMNLENAIFIFEPFIPQKAWHAIFKISITHKDLRFLKWISFNNIFIYRKYYLKVTYKNLEVKCIAISLSNKNDLKQYVQIFNHYLKTK